MKTEINGRKLEELTEVNEHGYIGFKFEDSKRFASAKVQTDKDGKRFFVSKGEKCYFEEEVEVQEEVQVEENNGLDIVDEFLAQWKKQAAEYYMNLRKELVEVRNMNPEITPEGLKLIPKNAWGGRKFDDAQIEEIMNNLETLSPPTITRMKSDIKYRSTNAWKAAHTKAEIAIVESMFGKDGGADVLNQILDREVVQKKAAFIARVEKKSGKILDASGLRIGVNGEINGTVVGEIKTVSVQTIYAGGFNIQCLHYRVLVK